MSFIAIPVEEERKLSLHSMLVGWRKAGAAISDEAMAAMKSEWRVSRIFSRIAFFFLSILAASAFFGLLELFSLPGEFFTGVGCVVLAEMLVGKRFLRTGIEEAFYIAGLSALIFSIPSQGSKEGMLLFAAAGIWAGFRLAQTFYLWLATAIVVIYLVVKTDQVAVGAIACLVIFFLAQVGERFEHARPFLSNYLSLLTATAMPASLALFCAVFDLPERVPYAFLVGGLLIGAAAVFQALRTGDRPLLIGGALTALIAGAFLGVRLDMLPAEWETIVAGSVTLAAALAVNRQLRGRQHGLTSDAVTAGVEVETLEMAGSAALAAATTDRQAHSPEPTPEVTTADPSSPSFGGAGAGGDY